MSDDKTKRTPQDAARINVHEPYEVRYWTEALGVTEDVLNEAVERAGPDVEAVRKYIGSNS
ncbi:DUF3606 domain-containing protein [Caulobacter segnis]|uniref:DUF3606 domain-containing protein n=1 Tax=Caulobacter segnis TaxID=88688 RepID=A0A2W5V251_9CAUL|nr:DUF3606 domain-containing protein [Caulobacter segnis]PZR31933.1 MAG: DUF3606 domain-containing protein [Caulobacter segnis]